MGFTVVQLSLNHYSCVMIVLFGDMSFLSFGLMVPFGLETDASSRFDSLKLH